MTAHWSARGPARLHQPLPAPPGKAAGPGGGPAAPRSRFTPDPALRAPRAQRTKLRPGRERGRRARGLTCGSRSRIPAAWMSSQPVTRSSVSVSGSRPLLMDGVKRSVCSGRRQFSSVISTPEYSRSPISTAPGPGTGAPLPAAPDPAAVAPPA